MLRDESSIESEFLNLLKDAESFQFTGTLLSFKSSELLEIRGLTAVTLVTALAR